MALILAALTLIGLLLALSYVDLKEFRLPNGLTLALVITGLIQSHWLGFGVTEHLIGMALGYGFFVAVETGFKKLRGIDGLGRGDAKLLAGGGAWCGWMGIPFIVLIASMLGLIGALFPSIRNRDVEKVPFGPFLSLAILLVWIVFQRVYHTG